EPADAEGFSRRGAAFAARRDFEHALADFDRACTMAPAEPRYLYQRGMVRLENRQPVLALTDFDQALKLKPDDVATLLARAEMRLAQLGRAADGKAGEGKAGDGKAGDGRVGALADLDAAARAAAKSSDERLTIARLYASAFAFEPALVQTDLWIAAHPDDNQMGQALNGRCWTRAMLGRDLNKALSDCNAALRRQPAEAGFLDSRGLVRLRLGDLDRSIADYDAALALRPTNGWSLYGRGLARQRKGLKAEGDADIAAALALNPALADEARRAGLTP
ncbi:MAG TPA: tetratricopeptide repeat protein, partial [Caulobacteraceae bacterium]